MSVSQDNKRIGKAVLIGLLITCAIIMLLTCIFGFVLKMTSGVPYAIIDYVMIVIQGIAVFFGAYIACIIVRSKGLIIGAVIGTLSMLILLCCGFIFSDDSIGILTLIRIAVTLLCGIVGGIAGVNKKEKIRIK